MSEKITIINSQNQEEQVDLVCYFKNNDNNNKYLFYTKNEIMQDGLVKLYVAKESTGTPSEISPEEWNELKGIMQDIIKGVIS